jgi:hypothetical protein
MRQYGLSEQRVKRVLRNPYRKEKGIVKNTIAVMCPASIKIKNSKKVWSQEIWCMFQKVKSRKSKVKSDLTPTLSLSRRGGIKIISAWRYPGVSPKNNPIPEDILREIGQLE